MSPTIDRLPMGGSAEARIMRLMELCMKSDDPINALRIASRRLHGIAVPQTERARGETWTRYVEQLAKSLEPRKPRAATSAGPAGSAKASDFLAKAGDIDGGREMMKCPVR